MNIEEFLYQKKLAPQSNSSDFWTALINEKGKKRAKGETYTDNIRQTFRRELESDYSLNTCLQDRAQEYWENLIKKVLRFFGEQ